MVRALVRLPLGVPISNEPKFPAGVSNPQAYETSGIINVQYADPEDECWVHTRVYYVQGQDYIPNDIEKECYLMFESSSKNQYKEKKYTIDGNLLIMNYWSYYTVIFVTYSKDGFDKNNIQFCSFKRSNEII